MRKFAGIEINKDLISFVLLNEESNNNTVERTASCLLSKESPDEFFKKIKDHLSSEDYVSVSLPLEYFLVRNIKVPFRSKDKIEKILNPELEEHIPFDINNFKTSFKLTDNSSVISFSINEEFLNNQISLFKENDINIDLITITGLSSSEIINQRTPEQAKIIIKESGGKVSFFFYDSKSIIFTKSVYGKITEKNFRQKLTLEIKLLLSDIFRKSGREFKPDRIFIDVSGEYKEHLTDLLFEIFGIKCEEPELFKNIEIQYVSAAALALYSSKVKETINFTKRRNPFLLIFSEYKRSFIKSAVFASICLLFIIINTTGSYINSSRIIETYDSKMISIYKRSFPGSKLRIDPYPAMISKVKELSGSNPEINSEVKKIDILNEINRNLPKDIDVVFTKISMGGGVVSISGQTQSFILVDTIKKQLDKISFFESVSMSSPTKSGRGNRVNFRLNIKLKRV